MPEKINPSFREYLDMKRVSESEWIHSFKLAEDLRVAIQGKIPEKINSATKAIQDHMNELLKSKNLEPLPDEHFADPLTFADRMDNPSGAGEFSAQYKALNEHWTAVVESMGRVVTKAMQQAGDKSGAFKEDGLTAEKMRKTLQDKVFDLGSLITRLALIGGALYLGIFTFKKMMEGMTGCYQSFPSTKREDVDLKKTCSGITKEICNCAHAAYVGADSNSSGGSSEALVKQCAGSGVVKYCWLSMADYDKSDKKQCDYQWNEPSIMHELGQMLRGLSDMLNYVTDTLSGPLIRILILVGCGIAGLVAIGLMWRFLPKLFGRRTNPAPGRPQGPPHPPLPSAPPYSQLQTPQHLQNPQAQHSQNTQPPQKPQPHSNRGFTIFSRSESQ
jgi:hypothetical protein